MTIKVTRLSQDMPEIWQYQQAYQVPNAADADGHPITAYRTINTNKAQVTSLITSLQNQLTTQQEILDAITESDV